MNFHFVLLIGRHDLLCTPICEIRSHESTQSRAPNEYKLGLDTINQALMKDADGACNTQNDNKDSPAIF